MDVIIISYYTMYILTVHIMKLSVYIAVRSQFVIQTLM